MHFTLRLSGCRSVLRVQENIKIQSRGFKLNYVRASRFEKLFPPREEFETRHIGPRIRHQDEMLNLLGFKAIEKLYSKITLKNYIQNLKLIFLRIQFENCFYTSKKLFIYFCIVP